MTSPLQQQDLFSAAEDVDCVTFRLPRDVANNVVILDMKRGNEFCLYAEADDAEATVLRCDGRIEPTSVRQASLILGCRSAYVSTWSQAEGRQYELKFAQRLLNRLAMRIEAKAS